MRRGIKDGGAVLVDGVAESEPVAGSNVGGRQPELVADVHAGWRREHEAVLEVGFVASVVVDREARRCRGVGHDAFFGRHAELERLAQRELLGAEGVGHLHAQAAELRGLRTIPRRVAGEVGCQVVQPTAAVAVGGDN